MEGLDAQVAAPISLADEMDNVDNPTIANIIASNGLTADQWKRQMPSAHKKIILNMIQNVGDMRMPLSRDLMKDEMFNNKPRFWSNIWASWSGINALGRNCLVREIVNRGKSLSDKFNMKTWEELMQMPMYEEMGEKAMTESWERFTGVWEEASSKAPVHDSGDQKYTRSQSLQKFKREIRMPWDFATSASGMQVWESKMEAAARGSLTTWIYLMEKGMIREGMEYEFATRVRKQNFIMNHDDFVNYWRFINRRTFCLQKNGLGMVQLETDVVNEMLRERQVKPDSVLMCSGAARDMEFQKQNFVFNQAGPTMSQLQPNVIDEDSALCLQRLGHTKQYGLAIDEGLPFSSHLDDTPREDPMSHRKYCSQYFPMCANLRGGVSGKNYATKKRNIQVIDALSNQWNTVQMRDAFAASELFHKDQPTKLATYGPMLLAFLCRRATSANGIGFKARDPHSSLFDAKVGRDMSDDRYGGGGRGDGDDDDSDSGNGGDEDEDDATFELMNEDEKRAAKRERIIRGMFRDKDTDYAYNEALDGLGEIATEELARLGRISTVDGLSKGINAYNLCVSQGCLLTLTEQLIANKPALLYLTRKCISEQDDEQNLAARNIYNQMEAQAVHQKAKQKAARVGLKSCLPNADFDPHASRFAQTANGGPYGRAGLVNQPTGAMSQYPGGQRNVKPSYGVALLPRDQALSNSAAAAGTTSRRERLINPSVVSHTLFNFLPADVFINDHLSGLGGSDDGSKNVLDFAPRIKIDRPGGASERALTRFSAALQAAYVELSNLPVTVDGLVAQVQESVQNVLGNANLGSVRGELAKIWVAHQPRALRSIDEQEEAIESFNLGAVFAANLRLYVAQMNAIDQIRSSKRRPTWSYAKTYDELVGEKNLSVDQFVDRVNANVNALRNDDALPDAKLAMILQALKDKSVGTVPLTKFETLVSKAIAEVANGTGAAALTLALYTARMAEEEQGNPLAAGSAVAAHDEILKVLLDEDYSTDKERKMGFDRLVDKIATATSMSAAALGRSMLNAYVEAEQLGVRFARAAPFLDRLSDLSEQFIHASINGTIADNAKIFARVAIHQLAMVPRGNAAFEAFADKLSTESNLPTLKDVSALGRTLQQDTANHPQAEVKFNEYKSSVRALKKKSGVALDGDAAIEAIKSNRAAPFDLVTQDHTTVHKLLMRTRLTRAFFDWLMDNNFVMPMSWLLFRMAIETRAGNAIFYKKGDDTAFLCMRGAQVAYQEEMHEKEVEIQIEFDSNLLVHNPQNIMVIPDVFPMSYEGGGGITFNTTDVNPAGFDVGHDAPYNDMTAMIVDYDFLPQCGFLPIGGFMDSRLYSTGGEIRAPNDWYPTASIYNQIWSIKRPDRHENQNHMASPWFYMKAEPRDLWLPFRGACKIFVDDHTDTTALTLYLGDDAIGTKYVSFSAYGGLDSYGGDGTQVSAGQ